MKTILPRLTILSLAFACAPTMAQRLGSSSDAYGYVYSDSAAAPAVCAHTPIVLDGGASALAPSQPDDGVTDLALSPAFEFYAQPFNIVRVTTNGYLAFETQGTVEDGGDFSADCPLPAVPGNAAAALARIYALHADLQLDATAQLLAQFFDPCPRLAQNGAVQACTVVEWRDVQRAFAVPADPRAIFQTVLYHASAEVTTQYLSLPPGFVPDATVGLQNFDTTSGLAYRCGQTSPAQGLSVCAFDPRFFVADLIFFSGFE